MVQHLNKDSFREKVFDYEKESQWNYGGELPCIIDFYADWCGPCKMVSPILEELSDDYEGRLNVYKVDTDREQELASLFGVRSIPTLLFVPTEGDPQVAVGALPKKTVVKLIHDVLSVE